MDQFIKLALAWFLAVLHPIVTLIILFGWHIPEITYIYILMLVLTACSWLLTGGCILSKLEYEARKNLDPQLEEYDHSYIHFHLRKWLGKAPSINFIRNAGYVFIPTSIVVWIVNYFNLWQVLQ
jgi:Fe2+ transport system protein B